MDSDSFKSVIVCGQCGEWFGDMLSQVHHLTTHSFTKTTGCTVRTKSVLDFLQRCDRDAAYQNEYAHSDSSPGYTFDKWRQSGEDAVYDEKNGTETNEYASVSHQRDKLNINRDFGESSGCNSQLHQLHCEGEYYPSGGEHETDDIADMGDHRACLFRNGYLNSVHLGHTDQNCEDLSGSELEVPENSRVLFSGTDEDSQDEGSKLPDLEYEDNESPCKFESRIEHQYEAFDVKDTNLDNRSSVVNRNESSNGKRSKMYDGYDYLSIEHEESPDTPVNNTCAFKLYQSNGGENTRMGQVFNTNCQDGMKVYLNTGLGKRKYSSVKAHINSLGSMDRSESLWDDTLQIDQTQSSSQQATLRRSNSSGRHCDPAMEDSLGVSGLNSTANSRGHVEISGEVPPGNISGTRILPFDQNLLEKKLTSTVDIKPYSEITDTLNSCQSLAVGVHTSSVARPMPKSHFETDMNCNPRSIPKQFDENRNQYNVHGRSRPRRYDNGHCKSDKLSFMLKRNPNCHGYSIYKPQVIEEGHTEALAVNTQKCAANTNEVIECNKKSHNFDSSLFDEKQDDYICNSLTQSGHGNYHSVSERQSQERPLSDDGSRKKSLGGGGSDQKCSICGQIFEVAGDLQKHLISHKPQCHFCGESFEELEDLSAHLDLHLNDAGGGSGEEGNHKEDLHLSCDAEAPDHVINHQNDAEQVNPVNGPQKNYRCEICSKLFVAKHTLRIHMNIHLGRRSTCPVCKQTFSTDWSVKRHAEKCHHQVKVSEKSFSSPNSLRIQRATKDFVKKENKSLFMCEVCEREFSSMKSLSNHSRTHQNRVEELHQYIKTFRCGECDHVYSRPDSLMAHMKVHGDKYRHICTVCFAGFPTVTELDSHMQQHANKHEQLNTCSFCGIAFDLHTSLVQHIQNCRMTPHGRVLEDFKLWERDKEKRSDERRFQCSVCSKMYLSKKSLKHHMKVKGHIASSN